MHELNNLFAQETSYLELEEWADLVTRAKCALCVLPDKAFLLAFDRKPAVISPNYDWLAARHDGFIYVDRVVVSDEARGAGLGKALYAHLFEEARQAGFTSVACEINIDPPNLASLSFHQRLGFSAVGEQDLLHNGKTVRYFLRAL